MARSDRRRRPVLRAGALATTATIGAWLAGPGAAGAPAGGPATVRHDITLTDFTGTTSPTPNLWDGLAAILDASGIGNKTLPELIPSSATVGSLLTPAGLSVSTPLTPAGIPTAVLNLLGLNTTLGTILTDLKLPPGDTMDQLLGVGGPLAGLGQITLDTLLTPLGIASTQTTLGLAERFNIAGDTLDQILAMGGFSGSETITEAMNQENMGGILISVPVLGKQKMSALLGLAGVLGTLGGACPTTFGGNMTMDQLIQCFTYDGNLDTGNPRTPNPGGTHLTGSTTVYDLLTTNHFYNSQSVHTTRIIGTWTLGEIASSAGLKWTPTTTVQQFIDTLHINTNVGTDTSVPAPTIGAIVSATGQTSATSSTSGVTISDTAQDKGSATIPIPSTSPQDGSNGGGPVVATLPTLGSTTFGNVLTWLNLNPNDTLIQLLGEIKFGSTPLSSLTLGQALDSMMLNPNALGAPGTAVTMNTPLDTFMTALGGPIFTDTIDQLLHIS